jgi:beta-glucosidase
MSGKAVAERILKFHKHRKTARIIKTGKPVVLVLFTGRPLVLVQENETVPAILNTWFW